MRCIGGLFHLLALQLVRGRRRGCHALFCFEYHTLKCCKLGLSKRLVFAVFRDRWCDPSGPKSHVIQHVGLPYDVCLNVI